MNVEKKGYTRQSADKIFGVCDLAVKATDLERKRFIELNEIKFFG